jgi:hypothetical protein
LLIDSSHRWWIVVFVLGAVGAPAVHAFLGRHDPDALTGGSTVGLWYGIVGTALMIYAGLLSAVRKFPKRRFPGRRQTWLRGHIWLGLLSVVFILGHSNYRWGGTLEQVLWIVFLIVIVTGVFGLVLQGFLPHWLATRVPCEIPYEQIPHICPIMRRQADALVDGLCGPADSADIGGGNPKLSAIAKGRLRALYETEIRPFLAEPYPRALRLASTVRAEEVFAEMRDLPTIEAAAEEMAKLKTLCVERRLLAEQERLHRWLHHWLLIHIPVSVALLVLGVVHVWTALKY